MSSAQTAAPSRYFQLPGNAQWYCDDGVQCFSMEWARVSEKALALNLPITWPYTWTHTSGAFGHAYTADAITQTAFSALIDKWNLAGAGQWRFYEGHRPQ